jgi:hypothetical protein
MVLSKSWNHLVFPKDIVIIFKAEVSIHTLYLINTNSTHKFITIIKFYYLNL